MNQEKFDQIYTEGIEQDKISLTDSNVITHNDLIDAAIYKMYYTEKMDLKEIEKILKSKLSQFKQDFKGLM